MKIEQVAIQLYTLRDFCKNATDYAATMRRVREIGYRAVQISAVGPIPAEELRTITEGEGLTICATHEPSVKILTETDAIIERLQTLNCRHTAYPGPVEVNFEDEADVTRWLNDLDTAARKLSAVGLTLSYHNHAYEFFHYQGRPILEAIAEKTSLPLELDTYWAQIGGGSPLAWCQRLHGKMPLIHLKDYAVTSKGEPYYTEIGAGNLDFRSIIAAADEAGTEWFIVEQDTCPGDPFDSITKSFHYLRDHLAQG